MAWKGICIFEGWKIRWLRGWNPSPAPIVYLFHTVLILLTFRSYENTRCNRWNIGRKIVSAGWNFLRCYCVSSNRVLSQVSASIQDKRQTINTPKPRFHSAGKLEPLFYYPGITCYIIVARAEYRKLRYTVLILWILKRSISLSLNFPLLSIGIPKCSFH